MPKRGSTTATRSSGSLWRSAHVETLTAQAGVLCDPSHSLGASEVPLAKSLGYLTNYMSDKHRLVGVCRSMEWLAVSAWKRLQAGDGLKAGTRDLRSLLDEVLSEEESVVVVFMEIPWCQYR